MDKLVRKFTSFSEEEKAELEYYRSLSIQDRVRILISLIGITRPEDGIIERSVRIYPLAQRKEG
ncbi:MAG: hypothetical protein GYA55_11685 [SAR324 cluster bacterium]|uniref:Uncharacterized protein n=1 Tax=SAR324 cluster bacterium TaxID=2024889 RepID=A0A7X9FT41_9DELT|nr:hypothetical protein [SAR324 cluster bacterium]